MNKTMVRWVTGGVAAVMAVGGLGVPAHADDDVAQIPMASADKWHAGWCAKGEEGYSVLIDLSALDPKDRGDLNPATTTYKDDHVKDGWFVRCHKGLEPVNHAEGDDYHPYARPANWAVMVGVPGTRDANGWYDYLGMRPGSTETSSGDLIRVSAVTVLPDKDGVLPAWPEKVHDDADYPGKPADAGYLAFPKEPVKGMAVAIALFPNGHTDDPDNSGATFYFAGDNPNRAEHRPQYADPAAATPAPGSSVTPAPSVVSTAKDEPGSSMAPGEPRYSDTGRSDVPAGQSRNPGMGAGRGPAPVALPATGA